MAYKFPFGYESLNHFLILDTEYKDGDSYFGKVYGRGNANISGYGENMTIKGKHDDSRKHSDQLSHVWFF